MSLASHCVGWLLTWEKFTSVNSMDKFSSLFKNSLKRPKVSTYCYSIAITWRFFFGHPQVAQHIGGTLRHSGSPLSSWIVRTNSHYGDSTNFFLRRQKATPTTGHKPGRDAHLPSPDLSRAVSGHRPCTFCRESSNNLYWSIKKLLQEDRGGPRERKPPTGFCMASLQPVVGSAEEQHITHSEALPGLELLQSQRGLESWKLSRGNSITNEVVLNHSKMSFPWKWFCFFKSKTKPLRLQKNTTQRLRQFGELVCSFLPFPFPFSAFGGPRRDGAEWQTMCEKWTLSLLDSPRRACEFLRPGD